MQGDLQTAHIRRPLLQLAQATYAVFEREIPELEGLPPNGFAIIRLLRWHGPKTLKAIAIFLGVPIELASIAVNQMLGGDFVRPSDSTDDGSEPAVELAPQGLETASRIIQAQHERVQRATDCISPEHRALAGRIMEQIAYSLTVDSTGFGIVCAECWAQDVRECLQPESEQRCAFRRAERAQLDPNLSEGVDDAPQFAGPWYNLTDRKQTMKGNA